MILKIWSKLNDVRKRVLDIRSYYLYELELEYLEDRECKIDIDSYRMFLISDVDSLIVYCEKGYEFPNLERAKKILSAGGVGCFAFSGNVYCHSTWLCFNAKSKSYVDDLGFNVKFEKGEFCWGLAHTDPAFRGRGVYLDSCMTFFKYARMKGYTISRFTIGQDNLSSRATLEKLPCNIVGEIVNVRLGGANYGNVRPLRELPSV